MEQIFKLTDLSIKIHKYSPSPCSIPQEANYFLNLSQGPQYLNQEWGYVFVLGPTLPPSGAGSCNKSISTQGSCSDSPVSFQYLTSFKAFLILFPQIKTNESILSYHKEEPNVIIPSFHYDPHPLWLLALSSTCISTRMHTQVEEPTVSPALIGLLSDHKTIL